MQISRYDTETCFWATRFVLSASETRVIANLPDTLSFISQRNRLVVIAMISDCRHRQVTFSGPLFPFLCRKLFEDNFQFGERGF